MIFRPIARVAALALAGLAANATATMRLGVNTHFDQGWPPEALGQVADARADGIRDTVTWGKVEQRPGVYDFDPRNSGYAGIACGRSMPLLLMLAPRNKLYDGGAAVRSPAGLRAFGAYVRALADRFPCLAAIEIGNEINAPSRVWPAGAALPATYLPILRAARDALATRSPHVAILGGSSLSVATGFFERLFAAGMLPLVDGVAIHPYVDVPEQLPGQLARLRAAMARHGEETPIWATEFGLYYPKPEDAPPHALKVLTMLSAAHVRHAFWYALRDEPWFPNTGLYAGAAPKPALDTYRLAAERLLPAGEAHRIDVGDPMTFIYRFGDGPYVLWGQGRAISLMPGSVVRDARGRKIAVPIALGPAPIILDAPSTYRLGPLPVLADTLVNFGDAPWSHRVVRSTGELLPLRWIDWNWASYVGRQGLDAFKLTTKTVSFGGSASLIERYTSPAAGKARVAACFAAAGTARVTISLGGRELWAGPADAARQPPALDVVLHAGDGIDFSYVAAAPGAPVVVRRRIRILAAGIAPPPCAPG